MERIEAVKFARQKLDEHNLQHWSIRLNQNANSGYEGLCSYKDECIILNAHVIDQAPPEVVENTILHEIAHALVGPENGHNFIWLDKAKEIGCKDTSVCSTFTMSEEVLDAIRSGAEVEMIVEHETIARVSHKITRLQDKCPTCHKVAVVDRELFVSNKDPFKPDKKMIFLKCGHCEIKTINKGTPFGTMVSNFWKPGVAECNHDWELNRCTQCGEFKMFPFQIEGAQFLEAGLAINKGGAVFDEMGLGKTIQALAFLKFAKPEDFPVLFVVKSGIKFQWFKEIIRWLGPLYIPQVIEKSDDWVIPNMKCYIISYDLLVPKQKKLKSGKNVNQGFDYKKLDFIKTVVGDEVQQIKNPDSSRTQQFRNLCKEKKVIALSGTPWKNRGSEFFSILNILNPSKFHSYAEFIRRWVDVYYDGDKTKQGGIKNVPQFREYIKDIAIRREVADVAIQMPEVNRQFQFTNLEDGEMKVYDDAESEFVAWYNSAVIGGEEDNLSDMNILAQMARMRHLTGLAKIDATLDFLDTFYEETDRKFVIFVHHKDVGDILFRQMLKRYPDVKVLKLTAEYSSMERDMIQSDFNKSPRAFMVASTLASGEGINLQTCGDCILHERQWNPQNEDQAAPGRFRRIGAAHAMVNVHFMTAADTIDEILAGIVERKRAFFHNSMNKGEVQEFNVSIAKELAEGIVKRHGEKSRITQMASLKR